MKDRMVKRSDEILQVSVPLASALRMGKRLSRKLMRKRIRDVYEKMVSRSERVEE